MPIPLAEKLKIFSSLPDEECATILQDNLLEALADNETYLEWELLTKFINLKFSAREPLSRLFYLSFVNNAQILGSHPVTEWIENYRQTYKNVERDPETFYKFVNTYPEAQKLNQRDRTLLMRILRIFDYFLLFPIFEIDDNMMRILKFPMYVNAGPTLPQSTVQKSAPIVREKDIFIKTAIKDALKNQPEIGFQVITSDRIKIKSSPSPVSPTIKNWIYDYNFNMGSQGHNSMVRGNYLFQNENAKELNMIDRQRLSYLLKAYDEDLPVKINLTTKEIIFPVAAPPAAPATSNYPPKPQVVKNNPFIKTDAGFIRPPESQSTSPQPKTTFKHFEKKPGTQISASKNSVSRWKNFFKKPEKTSETSPKADWPTKYSPDQKYQSPKSTPFYTHNILLSPNSNEKTRPNIVFGQNKPINQKNDSTSHQSVKLDAESLSQPKRQDSSVVFASPSKKTGERTNYSPNRIIPFSQSNQSPKNNTTAENKNYAKNVINLKDFQ